MKIVHSADWHISKNSEKCEETVRCIRHMLALSKSEPPDLFCLSGDLLDEMDGRIALDSEPARVAIELVTEAASIAPVAIVRGTKTHDRDSPFIFRHLKTVHPVHVSNTVEQIALVRSVVDAEFVPLTTAVEADLDIIVALTMVPSLDKTMLMAYFSGSVRDGNVQFRELTHDLFAGIGLANEQIFVPRILMLHGMLVGSQFSSGQIAVGEDLEFNCDDLLQAKADLYCLGHVHMFQAFHGKIFYSGSPGRLSFGETEEKGYLVHEFDGSSLKATTFHKTPARSFCFGEAAWDGNIETFEADVARVERECSGADVRFRYSVPEEDRHLIDRAALEQRFMAAGAVRVKIECQIIPKQRQRAAGISQMQSLPEKVLKWGATVGVDIPDSVVSIASVIEGVDVEEILTSIDGGDINEAAKAA